MERDVVMGLHISINTLSITRESVGIRTLLTQLVPALVRGGGDHQYRLICNRANADLFPITGDRVDRVVLPTPKRRPVARIWHDQVTVPWLVRNHTDVLFTPSSVGSLLTRVPQVVAVPAHLACPSVRRDLHAVQLSIVHRIYYGPMMRMSHRRAQAVAPISEHLAERLVADTGLEIGKVQAILCGVDAVEHRPPVDGRYALFVGTLHPYKNARVAMTALALARPRLPRGFRLVVVGRDPDGHQLAALTSHAASEGVADLVDLLGSVDAGRLEELYREATVVVVPSLAEGFGLPALEAMARGIPVIASNRTALPEVVADGGLIIDPDDPHQFAARLIDVANNPTLQAHLAEAGRRRAEELSWDRAAEAYIHLFERVARHKNGDGPRFGGSRRQPS